MMRYTIDWIGPRAIALRTDEKGSSLSFFIAEGQSAPSEFQGGDEVKISNFTSHPSMPSVAWYDLTHIPSGKMLRISCAMNQLKVASRNSVLIARSGAA
jgi:hypothetical protein